MSIRVLESRVVEEGRSADVQAMETFKEALGVPTSGLYV